MAEAPTSFWDSVLDLTISSQQKGVDPAAWAAQIRSIFGSHGVSLPSRELSHVLVSNICWDNNVPAAWKFLEKAVSFGIVSPFLVLALLSTRVIPSRRSRPSAFRLYMELLKRHAFKLKSLLNCSSYAAIMNSIDNVLHLSQIFGLEAKEPGILLVELIFSIVWQLLDALLEDEGLLELIPEKKSRWAFVPYGMEIDDHDFHDEKRNVHKEMLQTKNTVMAVEMIGQFLQDKGTSRILFLARRSMPSHWRSFAQQMQILVGNSSALRNSKFISPDILVQMISNPRKVTATEREISCLKELHMERANSPLASSARLCHGTSPSALWLPLDLVLEDSMDRSQVTTTSAVEIITGLMKSLQAFTGTTWHECFLGLWTAALRLVQRERDPIEGPVPRLDTRLCMLFSITTLVVADLIDEEESAAKDDAEVCIRYDLKEQVSQNRRRDLISSLQSLIEYKSLLDPPQSVVPAANQAAARAMTVLSGIDVGSSHFEFSNIKDMPLNCSGNLLHLIVEACIARNILDTSAYFWPGYVNGCINQIPHNVHSQGPGWSSFMKGAPLNPVMMNALVSTPASSLAELEKIFDIAVKGSKDEKIAAATILCGTSLIRGYNIQEHAAYFITRLLSSPPPADYCGSDSHLIDNAPMLYILLVGISPVDCVQIFSLHGLVPQLAASLMQICEVLGSCVPNVSWVLPTGEEISAYAVFSNAFALLLKLWRFNHPPLEHGVGDVPPVGSQLTPEYLLLVRNSYLVSSASIYNDRNRRRLSAVASSSSPNPIFMDSFPKLKAWNRQHQACIASTLSGLVHGTPVHHIVDVLLNMLFGKPSRGNQTLASASGSSSSSGPGNEDTSLRPKLPAWDILEAVPFVVDAALTACAHGRLTPRDLCTGLKGLADFLPASLATIVSYFSAEVSRGVWKPVFMNGQDWPSPAANLSNVEQQIKKILAATGVNVPSLLPGVSSPATLPLPLAAFVSLTITYKLDKSSQRFLDLAGPALETLAAGCPWPCMPIVASLWTQKVKRWSDFLVFSASRTVFLHDNDAVVQLLKSCFSSTLSLNTITSNGGVGALLGHGFGSNFCGDFSPVAPGFLYLRVHHSIRDIMFLREEIVSVLMQSVRDLVLGGNPRKFSLATAISKVKQAASLGATITWLSGGIGLVQSLIKETLPSWFISFHIYEHRKSSGGAVSMLMGYALAYFTLLCGAFVWGVDSSLPSSKWRPYILLPHMEFLASALDKKISLGCDPVTWRAYVCKFVSLVVECTPSWVMEMDVGILKRLSKGLRQWNEEELALALLEAGGVGTMGAAAELIAGRE